MRKADDLSREEAVSIVGRIVDAMYLDLNQAGDCHDPDKSIDGADFIDAVTTILSSHGLVPDTVEPE